MNLSCSTTGSHDLKIDSPPEHPSLSGVHQALAYGYAVLICPQYTATRRHRQMVPAASMTVDQHIEVLRSAPKGTMVQLEGGAPPSTASEHAESLAELIAAKAAQAVCHAGADTYDFSGAYGGADSSGRSDGSPGRSQKSGGLQSPQLGDAGGANETAPRNDQSSGDSFKTAPSQIEAPSRAGASQALQQSPAASPLLPQPGCRGTRCKPGIYGYRRRILNLHAISATVNCIICVIQPHLPNAAWIPTLCTRMSEQHKFQNQILPTVPSFGSQLSTPCIACIH